MVVAHLGRSIYPPNCMDNVPSFFDIGRKTHIASFSYHLIKSIQQSWCGPTGRCKLFSKYFIGKRIIDEHLQVSICFYIDSNTIWSLKLPVIPLFWFLLCRCLVLMKMFLCPIQAGLCIKPLWEYTSITTLMSVILQPHLNEPHSQAIRVRAAYALICTSNNLILYVMCQWICKKHQINLIIIRIIVLLSFPND